MPKFNEDKQDKKISELHKQEEEDLAKLLSEKYSVKYADLSVVPINTDALRLIKEKDAMERKVASFDMVGKRIALAVKSPKTQATQDTIKELVDRGFKPEIFMVSSGSLERAWERYKEISYAQGTKAGLLDISNEEIKKDIEKIKSIDDARKMIEETLHMDKSHRISKIVEVFLAGAISIGSSDVHIEPEEKEIRLRFRLDGVLTDVISFERETFKLLLSRIKLLSNLKLNVRKNAQDGRFSIKLGKTEIEIRTSILPGNYGESIVLRILNPDNISSAMGDLGIEEKLLDRLKKEIGKPNGMILTTGPTGSGKTTTLYAFMAEINKPEIKIITIENPIEYHLEGIVQTQTETDKGYTFSQGLRSALRQDPDVIMVGEIRDDETASIAINASLTGHLVFSTLHTNDAPGTFPRLIDLGIDPKVIGSAINVAIAQRLLRKLCTKCRLERAVTEKEKVIIQNTLDSILDKNYIEGLSSDKVWVAKTEGCDDCNAGYKGRTGIFEVVFTDEKIEAVIKTSPSARDIKEISKDQGFLDMRQDGIIKSLRGITSLDELKRVIDIEK